MNRTIRIVIADDHPIFLSGLRSILEKQEGFEVAGEASNGKEAVELVQSEDPDVVILDIDMPVMNGWEAVKAIRAEKPETPISMLTMHNSKTLFDLAMELGVRGYVLKENAILDVVECIRAIERGDKFVSPDVRSEFIKLNRGQQNTLEKLRSLTPTELIILKHIAAYKTSQKIADEMFVSRKTVSNHRNNISLKLELKGNHSLMRFAIENADVIGNFTEGD